MGQSATRLAGAFSAEGSEEARGPWAPREPLAAVIDLGSARRARWSDPADLASSQPASSQPASSQPASSRRASSHPASSHPASSHRASSHLASSHRTSPHPASRRRPSPSTARLAPTGPLRLTARGRVVLRLAALTVLVAFAFGLAQMMAGSTRAADPPTPRESLPSVVVRDGDTLWTIAVRHRPAADPRVTMEQIRRLNDMRTATVEEGQELVLPPR